MKTSIFLVVLMHTTLLMAQTTSKPYGYLEKEDQQFFKNDSMEGNNRLERIDANVKEINKLHGELNSIKAEMAEMKKEIEMLKSGRK